ncbi:MAG: hypothetical protein K2J85_00905, partial [Anaeroplasmataceae bacterium]|nr:hypothetical protein [Anaeroplasmataceae bacterium]
MIKNLSISYATSRITVRDVISKDYTTYSINLNRVTAIKEYANGVSASEVTTLIIYEDRRTTIIDNDKKKTYIYFDTDNLPLFVIDDEGNAVETKYNSITKKLIHQSSVISTKNKPSDAETIGIIDFKSNGITRSTSSINNSINDAVLSSVLGQVYEFNGSGSLTYTLTTKGFGNDTITAVIWGRQKTAYTGASNVTVILTADGKTQKVFEKKKLDNEFELLTVGLTALKSYSQITITFVFTGNATIQLGEVQLLKKNFGTTYVYDEHGNVIEADSGKSNLTYTYDSKGLQTASNGKNSAVYCYEYDSKGNVISARTAHGGKIEYQYDKSNKNNIVRKIISNFNSSEKLETLYA